MQVFQSSVHADVDVDPSVGLSSLLMALMNRSARGHQQELGSPYLIGQSTRSSSKQLQSEPADLEICRVWVFVGVCV